MQATSGDDGTKRAANNWLIAAAASFFLCGCFNLFAIIGGVLCFLAIQAAERGHFEDAAAKLKWGKIVIVGGAALTGLVVASAALWYLALGGAT